jgi:hypothetical protein
LEKVFIFAVLQVISSGGEKNGMDFSVSQSNFYIWKRLSSLLFCRLALQDAKKTGRILALAFAISILGESFHLCCFAG